MFTVAAPKGEYHGFGGEGIIYAGKAEMLYENLLCEHAGRLMLVFLDPPAEEQGRSEFKGRSAERPYEIKYDSDAFLALMRKTLQDCYKLLAPEGSLYIRIEPRRNFKLRALADEIFGEGNFVNEIIRSYKTSGRTIRNFAHKHDVILFYRKSRKVYFNIKAIGEPRGTEVRNHMKRRIGENGKIFFSTRTGGKEYRYYEDDPVYPGDVWDDIEQVRGKDAEHTGYAGQLPEALLKRIILVSTREGDIILDPFSGSGTTASAAARLRRKFITADTNPASLLVSRKRLLELDKAPECFKHPMPLKIDYSEGFINPYDETPPAEKFLKLSEMVEGCMAEIPDSDKPSCCYIAAGKLKNDRFYAEDYILRPAAGSKLFIKNGDMLHITDKDCNQYFYMYSGG